MENARQNTMTLSSELQLAAAPGVIIWGGCSPEGLGTEVRPPLGSPKAEAVCGYCLHKIRPKFETVRFSASLFHRGV